MTRTLLTVGTRIVMGIALLITALMLYPWAMRVMGYYVDNSGKQVGEIAAMQKNINICSKIIVYSHILGPTAASRKNECIFRYAQVTKDPTACELLMPSSYGLSCVSATTGDGQCKFVHSDVWWEENGKQFHIPYGECSQISAQRSTKGNTCCHIAKVALLKSENDCSPLKEDVQMFDECLNRLAFKNHDPSICNDISNGLIQTACVVEAKALREDPSICQNCTKPVDRWDDLQR